MSSFSEDIKATGEWFADPRFTGILRLYTPDQIVEQRGTIPVEYTIARDAAAAFHHAMRSGKPASFRFL